MNLPVKAVCKTNKVRKDGTSAISIQYCYTSDKRGLLDSGLSIPPKYWNRRKNCVADSLPEINGNAFDLNQKLSKELRKAEDIISLAIERKENPLDFFKCYYDPNKTFEEIEQGILSKDEQNRRGDIYKNLDIYFQIDDYIKTKSKKVSKDMPRIYRNMKDHLLAFEQFKKKPITFGSLNFTFYEELVDFLTYDYILPRRRKKIIGLKTNTVGKTIKQLKTFLKDRIKKEIIPAFDMDDWIVLEVEVDAVYLSIKEIEEIGRVSLTRHPHLVDYKNDLLLGCLTGLRFSDFSKIKQDDLRGGMLYKKQQKSDHWVVVPLRKEALQILEERDFKDFKAPTNAEFNRHIKNLARLAGLTENVTHSYKKGNKLITESRPKSDWITSHTCRRSFCTNEYLAGTPVSLIMKISGHKSERDFFRYIRISPEEAAYKMQDIWKNRGEL